MHRYGIDWPKGTDELTIELWAFRERLSPEEGGLGAPEHFWNIVEVCWNQNPDSRKELERNPESERIIESLCEHEVVSIAGYSGLGKSCVLGCYAVVNYISAPGLTKIFATSTSKHASKKRIWGEISEYWNNLPAGAQPGKNVDYLTAIRYIDEKGNVLDKFGVEVIACEQKDAKDAIDKMIGFHPERIIVIADELPALSEAIYNAYVSNLRDAPFAQFIGIGNPAKFLDAHGKLSTPVGGWNSVSVRDQFWKTRDGICIRFDAEQSPNYLAGEKIYRYPMSREKVLTKREKLGENSPEWWRMGRAMWCPEGLVKNVIYSEGDFILNRAMRGEAEDVVWARPPIRLSFLDPSFTDGGDQCRVAFAELGTDDRGIMVLRFSEGDAYSEDATKLATEPRSQQIVRQWKADCEARGVKTSDAGYDVTGGGAPFGDVVRSDWSHDVLPVSFLGSASDRQVSNDDAVPGNIRYKNKVTELWFAARYLLQAGQLRNLDDETITDLCLRTYDSKRTSSGGEEDLKGVVYEVEPKPQMRLRANRSPDAGDAFCGLIEIARERHSLVPGDAYGEMTPQRYDQDWEEFLEVTDVYSAAELEPV